MLTIVKLGGSVITHKNRYMAENKKAIAQLAKEIANARKKKKYDLIIVHGGGSFGHMVVKRLGVKNNIFNKKQKPEFAYTNYSCSLLSQKITEQLLKNKIPVIVINPLTILEHKNKKISKFDTSLVADLLKQGYVPMLRGDVVLDSKFFGSITSGDEQIPYLAKKLKANKMIYCTDVDGIFTSDPKTNKKAKLIPKITKKNIKTIISSLEEAKTHDVTGGMKRKILELLYQARAPILIINANKKGNLEKALLGKKVTGTEIRL